VINLQDITADVYRLIKAITPGIPIYNTTALYNKHSPYGVFTLTEVEQKEYFGDGSDADHTLALVIRLYDSRDKGAGAIRRKAELIIRNLHRSHPTLTGLGNAEILVRDRGQVAHAGNNLWVIESVFSITGTATGA